MGSSSFLRWSPFFRLSSFLRPSSFSCWKSGKWPKNIQKVHKLLQNSYAADTICTSESNKGKVWKCGQTCWVKCLNALGLQMCANFDQSEAKRRWQDSYKEILMYWLQLCSVSQELMQRSFCPKWLTLCFKMFDIKLNQTKWNKMKWINKLGQRQSQTPFSSAFWVQKDFE